MYQFKILSMNNKEFLENKPLELCLTTPCAKMLRKVIKIANETYVYDVREEKAVKCGNLQYYNFYITCPTTTFANAYFHFGLLYCKHVLPIWEDRFNRRAKKKLSRVKKVECKHKNTGLSFMGGSEYQSICLDCGKFLD